MKTRTMLASASAIFAIGYGSVGSYVLRSQYHGIHSFVDSLYYTFVTYSTVGYGDITPVTQEAKVFTISMILIGLGAFATVVTVLVAPLLEKKLKKVLTIVSHFHHLKKHAVICGINHMTLQMARDLHKHKMDVLFIDQDIEKLSPKDREVFESLQGNVLEESILKVANVKDASILLCGFDDDAQNILLSMMACSLLSTRNKHKPKFIVKLNEPNKAEYAKQSGADEIILPAVLSSQQVLEVLR